MPPSMLPDIDQSNGSFDIIPLRTVRTMKAVGYGRCSTAEQASHGVSIDVQRNAIRTYAEAHGWDLLWLADEGVSGAVAPDDRPKLRAALALLDAGEADALIFTPIDRASRKVGDVADLLTRAEKAGWRVIVTELGVDTGTPMGKAMAHVAAAFAELERDYIRQRTREGLAEKRAQGVQIGRPRSTAPDVVARITGEHGAGRSLTAIAADLNSDGVPTARDGKRWEPATVRALLKREGVL